MYGKNPVPFDETWRVFHRLGENSYLMVQHISGTVKFPPLFVYSFALLAPRHLLESEKFNIRFSDLSEITKTADKLRYYRYKKALLQREVADYIGIDCSTYASYEKSGRGYYPIEHMEKLASLLGVPVTDLLDKYNRFLYDGQGRQIKEMRRRCQMTQADYTRQLGVPIGTLQAWEQDRVQICKQTWRRLKIRG